MMDTMMDDFGRKFHNGYIERREMKLMERRQTITAPDQCNKNLNSFIKVYSYITFALISVNGKCTFRRCHFIF